MTSNTYYISLILGDENRKRRLNISINWTKLVQGKIISQSLSEILKGKLMGELVEVASVESVMPDYGS